MEIVFVENLNDEPLVGQLEFYYNGYFQIRKDGKIYQVNENQINKEPNDITDTFYVRSGGRTSLFTTTKFELAEAFSEGYNEAIKDRDTWEDSDLAKVYFGE